MDPLADPPDVAHERVALDPAQQVRAAPRFRLAPHRAGGEAFDYLTHLDEQPETAVLPAGLVEERLDRLLVVVPGQPPDDAECVDTCGTSGILCSMSGSPVVVPPPVSA